MSWLNITNGDDSLERTERKVSLEVDKTLLRRLPVRMWLAGCLLVKEFIKRFPKTDHPAAFGQHVNADITSLIEETNALLGTMVSCDDFSSMSIPFLVQNFIVPKTMFHRMHNRSKKDTHPH